MHELAERTTFITPVNQVQQEKQYHSESTKIAISPRLTNWSIGVINLVAWLPVYKTVAEVPFQSVAQEEKTLRDTHDVQKNHLKWQALPLLLSMIHILCYSLMLLMKRSALVQRRFDLMFYAALIVTYILFVSIISLHYAEKWGLQIAITLVFNMSVNMIQARLFALVFQVKEESRWVMMVSQGLACLLAIPVLYVDNRELSTATYCFFVGLSVCLCVSGLVFTFILFKSKDVETEAWLF